MEEHHASDTTASRLVLLTAVLALSVVAGAAFARVFTGSNSALRLGLAAAASVLLAGLFERRGVLLATVVSAAGLVVMIAWLVFPETTRYLLPTLRTYHAAIHAWRTVGQVATQEVAPTAPLDPLFMAAMTAVWTSAYAAHVLAVRARSPLLALVPPGALLTYASLLLSDGPRPGYVAAFLAAAMGMLFGDGLRRVGLWGPLTMWHDRRHRFGSPTSFKGARRIALACLGIAVFAPGILPGFRDGGLVDVHSKSSGVRVSIDPILDIRPALLQNPEVELFTVRSSVPSGAYWRLIALDRFDGQRWTASNPNASGGVEMHEGALRSIIPVGTAAQHAVVLQQRIRIERLGREWLPAAYDPALVSAGDERVRWDPVSSTLVSPDGPSSGFTYDVTSNLPEPTREELENVVDADVPSLARYLELPSNTPRRIYQIAHALTDAQRTMFDKALAIQEYLHSFRYDERVQPGRGVNDIVYFLTQLKAGYCVQFAGSMAVLLRALGIPARVAVGFTPGTKDPRTGLWRVTTRNAHAWVEVFFQGSGWLAFEPTPSRFNPVANAYLAPTPIKSGGVSTPACPRRPGPGDPEASCASTGSTQGSTPGQPTPRATLPRDRNNFPTLGPIKAKHPRGWRWWAFRFGLLAVALSLLSLPLVKVLRRRIALATAGDARERVLAAYRLMADQAADAGLARRGHETLWEYRSRLRAAVRFSDGHLDRLTSLVSVAAYSEMDISPDDADQAIQAARVSARDIAHSIGPARRVAGWFRVERVGS